MTSIYTSSKPKSSLFNAVLTGVAIAALVAFTANQVEELSTRLASHKPTIITTKDDTTGCVTWRGNLSCFERSAFAAVAAEMDAAEGSVDTGLTPEEFLKRMRVAQAGGN